MTRSLDSAIPLDLLDSCFDGAELVRVDRETRLIAVWNGSETINLYTPHLEEVQTGPYNISRDENGDPPTVDEVDDHIDDIFEMYEEEYR